MPANATRFFGIVAAVWATSLAISGELCLFLSGAYAVASSWREIIYVGKLSHVRIANAEFLSRPGPRVRSLRKHRLARDNQCRQARRAAQPELSCLVDVADRFARRLGFRERPLDVPVVDRHCKFLDPQARRPD